MSSWGWGSKFLFWVGDRVSKHLQCPFWVQGRIYTTRPEGPSCEGGQVEVDLRGLLMNFIFRYTNHSILYFGLIDDRVLTADLGFAKL